MYVGFYTRCDFHLDKVFRKKVQASRIILRCEFDRNDLRISEILFGAVKEPRKSPCPCAYDQTFGGEFQKRGGTSHLGSFYCIAIFHQHVESREYVWTVQILKISLARELNM